MEGVFELEFSPLKHPRFLHQAVIVEIYGKKNLLILGGKKGITDANALDTVEALELVRFDPWKTDNVEKVKEAASYPHNFREFKPMNQKRCMFGAINFNNKFVYVFGGISSSKLDTPIPAEKSIERFDFNRNQWSFIEVVNPLPALGAFGWCQVPMTNEVFVLGGSDGHLLTSSLWHLRFEAERAECREIEALSYETETAMNKLFTREENGLLSIYVFGGAKSDGESYYA